jgi:RimJ/RimL family protein N-acetyltransferase
MGCPTIQTERLVLRPFTEADLDAFTAVMSAPEVRRALAMPDDFGREHAWREMALWRGQWELRGTGNWLLEERATGAVVGRAGLHRPERHDWPGVEVGWTLHPEHWGKGYATEAGRASIDYAFTKLDVDELWSVILPTNTASQAVARRLGLSWAEDRVLSFFPSAAHGLWRISRSTWSAR